MWRWPFKVVASQNDKLLVEVCWKGKVWLFTPVEICSLILMQVKTNVETNLRAAITDVVMTVPVQFNYEQRQAIKCAGTIAGLNVMQIVSAPAACALFFGTERLSNVCRVSAPAAVMQSVLNSVVRLGRKPEPEEYNMLIFDLGAGTLDVSLITIKEAVCKVRATAGDIDLGGLDIDTNLIYNFVQLLRSNGHKDISNVFRAVMSQHRTVFEGAKIYLSSGISLEPMRIGPLYNSEILVYPISAGDFNKHYRKLFLKCTDTIDTCLRNAKIEVGKVDEVILVGGSTRMPVLRADIKQYFKGKELKVSKHLETAVAYGAALQGSFLMMMGHPGHGRFPCLSLQDATSFSLGVQFPGGLMDVCIPKNTTIPTIMEKIIYCWHYNNRNFLVHIYEGEGRWTSENNLIGTLELSGDPLSPNGCGFKVYFEVDANGALTVTSGENSAGRRNGITVTTYNIEDSRRRVQEALLYKEIEKLSMDVSGTKSSTESANPHKQNQMRDEKSEKIVGQCSRQHIKTEEYAIGIDLGTTHSCIAVWQQNAVKIIENEYGSRVTSSCVAFTDTGRLIGDTVNKEQVATNPTNTIPSLNFTSLI